MLDYDIKRTVSYDVTTEMETIRATFASPVDAIAAINDCNVMSSEISSIDCKDCTTASAYIAANLDPTEIGFTDQFAPKCLNAFKMRTYIPIVKRDIVSIEGEDMYEVICLNHHRKRCKKIHVAITGAPGKIVNGG